MPRSLLIICVLVSLLGGCKLKTSDSADPNLALEAEGHETDVSTDDPVVERESTPAGKETPEGAPKAKVQEGPPLIPDPAPAGLSRDELSMWNDPRFKREFTQSYLSETDIEPKLTPEDHALVVKVMQLMGADKLVQAETLVTTSLTPDSSAVYDFTLGNVLYQQDKLDDASAAYQESIRKFPKFRRAWGNLAQIQYRRGEFDKAIESFGEVIALGGASGLIYGLMGVSHSKLGNDIAAESAFRQAMMLDPKRVHWKMGLADSFFKQRRFADAVSLFDDLIAAAPDRPELWLAQGEAYAQLNKPMKAAENFELVDRLGGSTFDSLNNLGDIYATEKLYDLAVGAYLRAMKKKPDSKPGRAIRAAGFLSGSGALAEAETLLDGIQGIYGERMDEKEKKSILQIRARLAVAQGAGEQEAKVLKEIVALDPLDGEALILLGQHASRTGDPDMAINYYQRAADIDEKYEADAKVRHAQLLVTQGKYSAAVPLLQRAQKIKPRDNIQKYLEQVQRAAKSRASAPAGSSTGM